MINANEAEEVLKPENTLKIESFQSPSILLQDPKQDKELLNLTVDTKITPDKQQSQFSSSSSSSNYNQFSSNSILNRSSFILPDQNYENLEKIKLLQYKQEKLSDEIQKINYQLEINSLKIAQNLSYSKTFSKNLNFSPKFFQNHSIFFPTNSVNSNSMHSSLQNKRNDSLDNSYRYDFLNSSNKSNQIGKFQQRGTRFFPTNNQSNINDDSLRDQINDSYLIRSFNNLRDISASASASQNSFNNLNNDNLNNSNLNSPMFVNNFKSQTANNRTECSSFTPPLTQSSSLMSINSNSGLNTIDRQVNI